MSQQCAQTPRNFLRAVEHKFGVKFTFDIACTTQDCVVEPYALDKPVSGYYFDLGFDALKEDWARIPVPRLQCAQPAAWLNPPWKNIRPWSKRCHEGTHTIILDDEEVADELSAVSEGIRIFSLFPAGVGTKWFSDYVHGVADVYFLHPRITYLDPRTGQPFIKMIKKDDGQLHPYRDRYGHTVPQTGLNDAILCDWAGSGETYCWDWQETLKQIAEQENQSLQDALNRV